MEFLKWNVKKQIPLWRKTRVAWSQGNSPHYMFLVKSLLMSNKSYLWQNLTFNHLCDLDLLCNERGNTFDTQNPQSVICGMLSFNSIMNDKITAQKSCFWADFDLWPLYVNLTSQVRRRVLHRKRLFMVVFSCKLS